MSPPQMAMPPPDAQPPASPNPGAAPSQGQPPNSGGQPPMGSSPATGPTQNMGLQAKALQAAATLVDGIAMIIPMVGAASPLGQSLAKAMMDISKHIPPGAVTPEARENNIRQLAQRAQQMRPQMAAMQAQMPPGAQPQPGAAPGGAPPMPQPGGS